MNLQRNSLIGLGALLASLVACEPGTDNVGASGSTGASGPGAGGDGGNGGGFVGSGGTGAGTVTGCSADLKYVVDEQGNVLQTCGPDEGCAGGMCIPACDAAAASQGSIGCDYVLATPHFITQIAPPCFAAFVTNNWDKPVQINVSRGGQNYDATQFGRIAQANPNVGAWAPLSSQGLAPGEVAVLFLSDDPQSMNITPLTCPIAPAVRTSGGSAVPNTGIGAAWHITTDAPVTLYDILPYGGAASYLPSAELVLPTSAWGTNVVSVLPPASNGGSSWGQVTASEATTFTVLPNVGLPSGAGLPGFSAGVQGTFTLQAGEYVQWDGAEMTGTILQADRPFSFTGGNTYQCYTSATSSGGGCDSGHQQVAPVSALGSDYVGIPYRTRSLVNTPESIVYRIVGVQDGTMLTFDPPVPGAPSSLSLGQSLTFESTTAFRVQSQGNEFPFYLGQAMSGCFVSGGDQEQCPGDEDYVTMLPPAQWLSRYVFFSDPTYPTTNLVFVRKRTAGAFSDVTLECLGTLTGWQPVGSSGEFEITNVDLIRNNAPNGVCNNGPQAAESAAPFGLMVWGLSTFASYGYPAGGNASTINTVVVPPVPQ